jgi:hypothetical protein
MYDRTGRSFHVKWCIEPISKLLKPKKYISYAVTWPGHKHASPMSSVSKYWIWHLLDSTTNRSLSYGQQKDCNCRIFVHMVCHLYFQSTETSNEMADTTRIPRMVWSWPNAILDFSCATLPPNTTVSSSVLTSLSEENRVRQSHAPKFVPVQ